jgi:hypothetical protein
MIVTPKAAFGYVLNLCTAEPGEIRTNQTTEQGLAISGHYFYVDGYAALKMQDSGERLQDRTAGWLSCEHNDPGTANSTVVSEYPQGAQWVCVSRAANQKKELPDLASLVLEDQATELLTQGTDLYLVRGTLVVGSKTFTGPTQIRVRSGDVTATSQGKSYSLRFL